MSFYRKSLQSVLTILLLLPAIFQSCSSDSVSDRRKELLSMVSDDAAFVVATDPSTILKSAGFDVNGNHVKASKELERIASKNNDAVEFLTELSNAKGLDYHNFVASASAQSIYAVFCLSNADDFGSWLKNKEFIRNTSGQYDVFSHDGLSIAINGDIAMIANWDSDEPEAIASQAAAIVETAKTNPLKAWKADRMCAAQTDMLYSFDGLAEAMKGLGMPEIPTKYYAENCKFAMLSLNFDGPTLKMNGETYDAEGHKTPMVEKGTYTPLSNETLALVKGYQLGWAFSVPASFGQMMTELYSNPMMGYPTQYAELLGSLFEGIKTMGMGISLKDNANLFQFSAKDLSAVITGSYDKAKLEAAVAELAKNMNLSDEDLAKAMAVTDDARDGEIHSASLDNIYPGLTLYSKATDNDFIMANEEATVAINPARLDIPRDVLSYGALKLAKSHPLLTLGQCPFGIDMEGYAYDDSYEGEIKLIDCEGGLIYNIISYISKF